MIRRSLKRMPHRRAAIAMGAQAGSRTTHLISAKNSPCHRNFCNCPVWNSSRTGVAVMEIFRRRFLGLTASATALWATARIASSQTYPTRQVRIVVGYAAGGGTDLVARLLGQWLSERLGQPFVVGESDRRCHQYRHRGGRARACRRLYAPSGAHGERYQRDPL